VISAEVVAAARAVYPDAGTLRVHPSPETLHPTETDRPGLNRFDDPSGRVPVRYTATRLVACLFETMSRFRPDPRAEEVLRGISGVDADDVDWAMDDMSGLADWLGVQRVGTVRVLAPGSFVEIETPELLVHLDKHPNIRAAVSELDPVAHLDVALLRLGGIRLGRPISQAVGLAVREWIPDALGLGYRSRFATDEPCWAIWHTTAVSVESVPLSPDDPQHIDAMRAAASALEITLPPPW
jgi:RES domain-containing protein